MLLVLFLHPSRYGTTRRPDNIVTEPYVPITTYIDQFGNQVGRIVAPAGKLRIWNDVIVEDSGLPDPIVKHGFIDVWDRPGLGVRLDGDRMLEQEELLV